MTKFITRDQSPILPQAIHILTPSCLRQAEWLPLDSSSEPLNHVGSDFGQGNPSFYQLENGAPVVENFYPEAGSNIEQIYLSAEYEDFHDGPRNDNDADPYSNCVPNLDGPGFYCIGVEGRLYKINMDGSLQTIAGLVTVSLPIYYPDWKPSIPTKVQTFIGTYDAQFEAPVDLTIDPRNHKIFYVADTENNRIAKVDTSGATPVISTYAGYCPKFPWHGRLPGRPGPKRKV